jgi:hypothetical protein
MTNQNFDYGSLTAVHTRIALPSYHFKALLKEKYDTIQEKEGIEGVVSITKLWKEMEREQVSRIQFEDDLFDLEKKQIIFLQRNSVTESEEEKEKAIIHPTRGILGAMTWK